MNPLKNLLFGACYALCVGFAACSNAPQRHEKLQGNYYTPQYAQGFCIDTANGTKTLTVVNPFQQANAQKYVYVLDSAPMQRVVCMSTTQLGFLDFIDKIDAVVGVSGAKYIFNPALQTAYEQGKIADVGYGTNINIETIVQLKPNAVLAYGVYNEFESTAKKLQELGIRVIYIGEYIEPHPLGKAEWAVAIAALFDCKDAAQQRFQSVANQYAALSALLTDSIPRVNVLLNAPWNDTWFMPCTGSNMGQYLHDAGGESVVPLRAGREAYPESIESVYALSQNAHCWLNAGNAADLAALQQMHKLIERLPVFAAGQVFNSNRRSTPQGGSDFFESGTVHPHLILKDLIHILHPAILPQHELYYYQQLE
ncbi:iron ABC transporter substrate-binding protein [Bacteroidia bacterium]|nr:iron ABC transporter substrate-binding protein [Bacteroidia bacterium]GHT81471.1 iron ABC transporter substrate-binding protein [Bacteroidia bacterium]